MVFSLVDWNAAEPLDYETYFTHVCICDMAVGSMDGYSDIQLSTISYSHSLTRSHMRLRTRYRVTVNNTIFGI